MHERTAENSYQVENFKIIHQSKAFSVEEKQQQQFLHHFKLESVPQTVLLMMKELTYMNMGTLYKKNCLFAF